MRPPTARQRVLAYLKKERSASVGQIGRALKMLPAAVRHHLGLLRADGRVRAIEPARSGARGRPAITYGLAPAVRGENLANAFAAFLDEARSGENLLAAAGARLAGNPIPAGSPAGRLAGAVRSLNEMHYEARWEAAAEGPRIVFANCPYAEIIQGHPELCRMDAALLGAQLGLKARQVAKMERGGPSVCVFMLGKRPAESAQADVG